MPNDPIKFVEKRENLLENKLKIFSFWYYILNILIMLVSMAISILGTIQLYLNFDGFGNWNQYLLITTGISALTAFFTSLISFFVLNKKISKYKRRLEKIQVEKLLWKEKIGEYYSKDRDLTYFKNVSEICNLKWEGYENAK